MSKDSAATGPKMLTRDEILRVIDVRTEVVDVPEWGGSLTVRGMTGRERDQYESAMLVADRKGNLKMDMANARARIVAICAVDTDGSPLFTKDDVFLLSTKSSAALDRVYGVAAALSGIGDRDLEELVKNSGSGQSDDSGSA